ncbi:proline dehydrogenase 2, mitochondrial-like [Magnolia sinica]|uniref:proline dehydrogenase 2, mitochondrial-like n=1 Tax=Magnolia sinica TaxID=86752 RepID=UPI002657EECB|nr:proline dehydrogenase 2, mitochondrial-like [Magnolia sinica]
MLEKIARGNGSAVLATHNLESRKVAAAKAAELKIGKGNQKLQFAQLKGMADGLSLGLRNGGFNVSKYLPFGPVENVIPYLLKRAEENRDLLSASTLDRQLMSKELKRRLKVAVMGREADKIMT